MNLIYKSGICLIVKIDVLLIFLLSLRDWVWEIWASCVHGFIFFVLGGARRLVFAEEWWSEWELGGCGMGHHLQVAFFLFFLIFRFSPSVVFLVFATFAFVLVTAESGGATFFLLRGLTCISASGGGVYTNVSLLVTFVAPREPTL